MQIDLTGFGDVTERLVEHLTFAAEDRVVFGTQNEGISKQNGCGGEGWISKNVLKIRLKNSMTK